MKAIAFTKSSKPDQPSKRGTELADTRLMCLHDHFRPVKKERGERRQRRQHMGEFVTEPVYCPFLQNTNTRTSVSEGLAVQETVTAGVHFCWFFLIDLFQRHIVCKWRQRPAYAANNLYEHSPGGY